MERDFTRRDVLSVSLNAAARTIVAGAGLAWIMNGGGDAAPKKVVGDDAAPTIINTEQFTAQYKNVDGFLSTLSRSVVAIVGGYDQVKVHASGFKIGSDKIVTASAVAQGLYGRAPETALVLYTNLAGKAGGVAIAGLVQSPEMDIAVLTVKPSKDFAELSDLPIPDINSLEDRSLIKDAFEPGAGVYLSSYQGEYEDGVSTKLELHRPDSIDPRLRGSVQMSGYVLGAADYGRYYRGDQANQNGIDVLTGFKGYNGTPDGAAMYGGMEGGPVFSPAFPNGGVVGISSEILPPTSYIGSMHDYLRSVYGVTLDTSEKRMRVPNIARVLVLDKYVVDALAAATPLPLRAYSRPDRRPLD